MFSRMSLMQDNAFQIIDAGKIHTIGSELKAVNEKARFLSSKDTQTTRKLMSLQMLQPADSTYRVLRQIMAQVERKQQAIAENYLKLKKEYLEIDLLKRKAEEEQDEVAKDIILVEIEQKRVGIANSISYLENAIKEVGSLLDTYKQILKNKNIPEDWSEADLEAEEARHHVRNAFRLAVRDFLVHGAIGMGTCEYFEQFGISPIEAIYHVKNFLAKQNEKLNQGILSDYDDFMNFLNTMADLYSESYKKACKRMGIDKLHSVEFLQGADR